MSVCRLIVQDNLQNRKRKTATLPQEMNWENLSKVNHSQKEQQNIQGPNSPKRKKQTHRWRNSVKPNEKKLTAKHCRRKVASKLCKRKLMMYSSIMFWIFLRVFFNQKSAVQTTWLYDSSAVQRLETAVQCTLHGSSFKPWSDTLIILNSGWSSPRCWQFSTMSQYMFSVTFIFLYQERIRENVGRR